MRNTVMYIENCTDEELEVLDSIVKHSASRGIRYPISVSAGGNVNRFREQLEILRELGFLRVEWMMGRTHATVWVTPKGWYARAHMFGIPAREDAGDLLVALKGGSFQSGADLAAKCGLPLERMDAGISVLEHEGYAEASRGSVEGGVIAARITAAGVLYLRANGK